MGLVRLLLLVLGFLALRRVVSWFSRPWASMRGAPPRPKAPPRSSLEDDLQIDQPIEEAEFEELPHDRP